MPFKSDKQRALLFAQKPDVAAKFVEDSVKKKPKNRAPKPTQEQIMDTPKPAPNR